MTIFLFMVSVIELSGSSDNFYKNGDYELRSDAENDHLFNRENPENMIIFQQSRITGTVTDQNGGPLPGVTVLVKGTSLGSLTDASGKYTINNVPQNATLVFSFVGMTTQEIPSSGRMLIDVVMKEEAIGLEEVVVIGYGTQKKINLTGAVSNVNSQVLESRPIASIGQGLQGTVSNLNVTQSDGSLGKASSFNIRGNTSLNGGSPLILVNGVPMDINLVNPSDIDNVTVLKDAASAAIYGARAAYGVILITTKSGTKRDKPLISLSMNYSVNKPTVTLDLMDSYERMVYINKANMRISGRPYFNEAQQAAIIAHYNDPSQPEVFWNPGLSTSKYWLVDYCANTDWPREILRDSYPMQQYTASVSGGSDKFDYYTSFAYHKEEGIARHFDERYNRYNFMTNFSYDLLEWFELGAKVSVNNSKKVYPPNNNGDSFPENYTYFHYALWPNMPVKIAEGIYGDFDGVPNIVQMHEEGGYRQRDITDVWLTGSLKLTPVKKMTFNMDYSFNVKDTEALDYMREQPFHDRDGNIAGYYYSCYPSHVSRTNSDNRYYVFNAYADYENKFDRHYVKAMVGFNQENGLYTSFGAEREKLMVQSIPYMDLSFGERYVSDAASEFAIRGAFSRVNYSYDDRYLFEFNGRYDGTSKFPKNDRFAFFPSVSLGWRVDNEEFFSGLKKTINMLKFRVSYGDLGNQAVSGYYPYIASYSSGLVDFLRSGEKPMSVYAPGLVSPTLTWETVTQQDFGVDFAVLDNRLTGTFDIYRRDTKEMLTASQLLPALLAVSEPQANAANMKTTGFDLTLDWKHNIGKVKYGMTVILSDYSAEITKFSNPSGVFSSNYVGKKIGEIWGMVTGGLFQTDEEAAALDQKNISGRKRLAGDLWFVDLNGDGKITRGKQTLDDPGDMKIIGNNTPRYSFGLRPNVSWKGFDLEVFLQGVAKRDIVLDNTFFLQQYTTEWSTYNKIGTDYWTPENTDAYFPTPLLGNAADVTATQTRYLQNAAYMRLKQLTFGYTIPTDLTRKFRIEKIRVYFSGNNLWEATKMLKISDPEQSGARYYPLNRSISFGANLDF